MALRIVGGLINNIITKITLKLNNHEQNLRINSNLFFITMSQFKNKNTYHEQLITHNLYERIYNKV